MASQKVAVTIDRSLLRRLDQLVAEKRFPNRSKAVQQAVEEKLTRLERSSLARECARLDRQFEQDLANEGLAGDAVEWPEY